MTTTKRRAKSGEIRMLNYDVIAYAPESRLHRNRITVRDKETGRVVEEKGYVVSWAVGRAVQKMILMPRDAKEPVTVSPNTQEGT